MIKQLLTLAFRVYPVKVVGIFFLTLANAVLGGVGIGLILPIIEGLQSPEKLAPVHPISRFIVDIFARFNLPVNLWILFITGLVLFSFQSFLRYLRVNLVAKTSAKVG